MQIFYSKDGRIKYARIRHYLGMESGKPKFSYCNQSVGYAEDVTKIWIQKSLIQSTQSKAVLTGEKSKPDQDGQVNGQEESRSNLENKLDPIWAVLVQPGRTSASQADDPGSNPGDRTS